MMQGIGWHAQTAQASKLQARRDPKAGSPGSRRDSTGPPCGHRRSSEPLAANLHWGKLTCARCSCPLHPPSCRTAEQLPPAACRQGSPALQEVISKCQPTAMKVVCARQAWYARDFDSVNVNQVPTAMPHPWCVPSSKHGLMTTSQRYMHCTCLGRSD